MSSDVREVDGIGLEEDYHKEIAPDFWLMNNHKWAFWAWEEYRTRDSASLPATLAHIDFHPDSMDDWQDNREIENFKAITDREELRRLLRAREWTPNSSDIRYDNFIACGIHRGLIDRVECFQKPGGEKLCFNVEHGDELKITQATRRSIHELVSCCEGRPLFFDLDIDVFNPESGNDNDTDHYVTRHWPDDEIAVFLDECQPLVANALVVTVAISFGCSGEEQDARRLTKMVLESLLPMRNGEG